MAHLTGNFTSETALSPAVREAISAAVEQGWADPKKQSQAAARARILEASARSEIAEALHTSPERLEILGEPALAHFIAIEGFTHGSSPLYTSTIDVGKIRAIARRGGEESRVIGVDENGLLLSSGYTFEKGAVLSLQATNGETGACQKLEPWREKSIKVIVDATHALPDRDLVTGFAATTFAATSWNGPQGLAIINIGDEKNFSYPLPHIAPIRTPGTYSLPLLTGGAVALSEYLKEIDKVTSLRAALIAGLSSVNGIEVLAIECGKHSRHVSIVVEGLSSEEVLRSILKREIAVDAGSACSPDDLAPSHVIASMGYPTTGHLRFTVHPHHSDGDIKELVKNLREVLAQLNS